MLSRRRDPSCFKPREANATVSVVPSNLSESPFFCAAGAHALDLPWGKRFRPERFREFWLWMLEVALPVAYESRERWW
jgi:hypothetical protein